MSKEMLVPHSKTKRPIPTLMRRLTLASLTNNNSTINRSNLNTGGKSILKIETKPTTTDTTKTSTSNPDKKVTFAEPDSGFTETDSKDKEATPSSSHEARLEQALRLLTSTYDLEPYTCRFEHTLIFSVEQLRDLINFLIDHGIGKTLADEIEKTARSQQAMYLPMGWVGSS